MLIESLVEFAIGRGLLCGIEVEGALYLALSGVELEYCIELCYIVVSKKLWGGWELDKAMMDHRNVSSIPSLWENRMSVLVVLLVSRRADGADYIHASQGLVGEGGLGGADCWRC